MSDWTPQDRRFSELGLRLLSAAALIPAGLFMVWSGGVWLAAGCAVFATAMAYEWGQMSRQPRWHISVILSALICLALLYPEPRVAVGLLFAGALVVRFLAVGNRQRKATAAVGFLYVTVLAVGLFALREGPWDGRAAALYFMSFVWASDAGAYFAGRGFGGPPLLKKESPNKTWSGAIGAVIITALCGATAANLENASTGLWVLTGIAVSMIAQMGDLLESGMKRRFGVKDSSQLIPGHGGVLDRVDGLGAVCAIVSFAFYLLPALPYHLGLS